MVFGGFSRKVLIAFSLMLGLVTNIHAAPSDNASSRDNQIEKEQSEAIAAANLVAKRGPVVVKLNDQGQLNVPENRLYIPQPEAGRLLRSMGNTSSPNLLGVIYPTTENEDWLAVVQYIKSGYVRDEEAKSWNASELLQDLKDGTESNNKDRLARGFPALEVAGWLEKPDYDAKNHRLVWSARVRQKGAAEAAGTANYNTYALGRDGYFSLNFVTGVGSVEAEKPIARGLLSNLSYADGRSYADYNSATDHVAEYGIAALVAGGVAKKLGFFAIAGAFLAKFAKVIFIAVIAFGGGVLKLFGSRRKRANT